MPHETERFYTPRLYGREALPFDQMFEADRYWMLKAVNGIKFRARIKYREPGRGLLELPDFFPYGT